MQYSWPLNRPNTAGPIAGVAFVPWSEDESPVQHVNLRFTAQYAAYTELSGLPHGAGCNGFNNIARLLNPAIGNDRNATAFQCFGAFINCK